MVCRKHSKATTSGRLRKFILRFTPILYLQPMEVANHTLAEATLAAPYLDYAVCIDADNRPAKHVGDWPVAGQAYPVRVVESRTEGLDLVHVLGFEGEAPYFNAFAPHRFEFLERVWLN